MMRIVIIGNSGGGKSVLARRLAQVLQLPCFEIDSILWLPGWQLAPAAAYSHEHDRLVTRDSWIIEGLGTRGSVPQRLERATHIILIDMPLWMHFWLAAERHVEWISGRLEHPPASNTQPAPLKGLFRTIADVDRDWMPEIRRLASAEEARGKQVFRLATFEELNSFVPPGPVGE